MWDSFVKYIYRAVDDHKRIWKVAQPMKAPPFRYVAMHPVYNDEFYSFIEEDELQLLDMEGYNIVKIERVIQKPAIQFKGSGFYKNDYKDK